MDIIKGVSLTPIKIITNPKGDVMHALKRTDDSFSEFGEAYFSTIHILVLEVRAPNPTLPLSLPF